MYPSFILDDYYEISKAQWQHVYIKKKKDIVWKCIKSQVNRNEFFKVKAQVVTRENG